MTRIFSKEKAVYNTKDAWHIWRRDAKKHASPNAGHTEAACAGALGIRLAGDTIYGSKVIKKPYIGDDKRAVLPEDICRCILSDVCGCSSWRGNLRSIDDIAKIHRITIWYQRGQKWTSIQKKAYTAEMYIVIR